MLKIAAAAFRQTGFWAAELLKKNRKKSLPSGTIPGITSPSWRNDVPSGHSQLHRFLSFPAQRFARRRWLLQRWILRVTIKRRRTTWFK